MLLNREYINFSAFLVVISLVTFILLLLTSVFMNKHYTAEKVSSYECGFEPFSDARKQINIIFFSYGLSFLLFDVEILLVLPGLAGFGYFIFSGRVMFYLFLLILSVGFIYELRSGLLNLKKSNLFEFEIKHSFSNTHFLIVFMSASKDNSFIDLIQLYYINYWSYIPEFFFTLFLVYLLLFGVKKKLSWYMDLFMICSSGLSLYLFVIIYKIHTPTKFLFGNYLLVSDLYVVILKILFLLLFNLYILAIRSSKLVQIADGSTFTAFVLFNLFVVFSLFFLGSFDLFVFYILLEGLSFIVIMMFILNFANQPFSKSALRYFCINAIASGCILFGIFVMFGIIGSTDLISIGDFLSRVDFLPKSFFLFFCFFFFGILLKLAIFPLSVWLPSVYEESSYDLIYVFGIIFKALLFLVMFRIIVYGFASLSQWWSILFFFSGFFSIIIGGLGAFFQKSIKSFLAFTSINHFGFMFLSLSLCHILSFQATLFYLFVYLLSNCLILILFILMRYEKTENEGTIGAITVYKVSYLNELMYLRKSDKLSAVLLTAVFISFAGLPPSAGFFAKYYVMVQLFSGSFLWFVLFLLLFNCISLFYYLRILKVLWFDSSSTFDLQLITFRNNEYSTQLKFFGILICCILYFYWAVASAIQYLFYYVSLWGGISILEQSDLPLSLLHKVNHGLDLNLDLETPEIGFIFGVSLFICSCICFLALRSYQRKYTNTTCHN